MMEPEEDGDHRYWACAKCGYESGYQKVEGASLCATGQVQIVPPKPVPVGLGMPGRRPQS
jgi:hypothetical protein